MKNYATHASYVAGFIISVLLTLTAYFMVSQHVNSHHVAFPHHILVPALAGLAIAQLITQLVLFLHLGAEPKPRWNLTVASFAALVVMLVVAGSLWIMNHLNYHMSPTGTNNFIMQDEGIHK